MASDNAKQRGLSRISDFHRSNAWKLSKFEGRFNVITSNGLNIYVADDEKVIALYKEFFRALKLGGTLITSFLTPLSVWKDVNPDDAAKQRMLFLTIIGVMWQNLRSEETTIAQLREAGFVNIRVIYDSRRMFLTVVAIKPV